MLPSSVAMNVPMETPERISQRLRSRGAGPGDRAGAGPNAAPGIGPASWTSAGRPAGPGGPVTSEAELDQDASHPAGGAGAVAHGPLALGRPLPHRRTTGRLGRRLEDRVVAETARRPVGRRAIRPGRFHG